MLKLYHLWYIQTKSAAELKKAECWGMERLYDCTNAAAALEIFKQYKKMYCKPGDIRMPRIQLHETYVSDNGTFLSSACLAEVIHDLKPTIEYNAAISATK